jgi:hypothetical protein
MSVEEFAVNFISFGLKTAQTCLEQLGPALDDSAHVVLLTSRWFPVSVMVSVRMGKKGHSPLRSEVEYRANETS